MKRDVAIAVAAIAAGVGLVLVACGAENVDAPRQVPVNPAALACKSFNQLAPNFWVFTDSKNRNNNLACVIRTQLLQEKGGDPPPLNDVLRAVFALLNGYANQAPERGAPPKEPGKPQHLCAPDEQPSAWPPVSQANQLCELRRLLYVMVHQGKGIDALNLVDPQLNGVLNYIIKPSDPHLEIAGVVSRACSQNGQCQLANGLNLLSALSAYLESSDGKKTITDLRTLLNSPTIQGFLDSSAPNSLTEDGAVAIAKVLGPALQNASAADLQNLIDQPPLNRFKTELQPVIDDVKIILMKPEMMAPLKKSLVCLTYSDANYDLVRMLYRLGLRDKVDGFGLRQLTKLIDDLQMIDERGALVHLLGTLSAAIRADEQAIDSAANVCQTLFSTAGAKGQSNAERALPVVADLLAAGIGSEVMCALDTLVWGCSGTTQPACPVNTKPPPTPTTSAMKACECKVHCGAQKPCGDECVAANVTCTKMPGTACE